MKSFILICVHLCSTAQSADHTTYGSQPKEETDALNWANSNNVLQLSLWDTNPNFMFILYKICQIHAVDDYFTLISHEKFIQSIPLYELEGYSTQK